MKKEIAGLIPIDNSMNEPIIKSLEEIIIHPKYLWGHNITCTDNEEEYIKIKALFGL